MAKYEDIFADIKKRLDNPEAIFNLHDKVNNFGAIPSGISAIDECLCGGLPEGRIIEIFGAEASGKTTVTLHFIKAAQKLGYIVYFIDAEHALDAAYTKRIGVDFKSLLFSQPDYGEEALETARVICESTKAYQEKTKEVVKSLIVIDSVPALVPRSLFEIYEKEGYDSSNALGAVARMLSQYVPPLVAAASKANATVVFINQEREKIGVTYGSPITTPGGRALKFFSSLRIKVSRIGFYEKGGEKCGIRASLMPVKSKMYSIFDRSAEFIITANGINENAALADSLIKKGIILKSGAWFKYGVNSWHGAADVEDAIRTNSNLRAELIEKLTGRAKPAQPTVVGSPAMKVVSPPVAAPAIAPVVTKVVAPVPVQTSSVETTINVPRDESKAAS